MGIRVSPLALPQIELLCQLCPEEVGAVPVLCQGSFGNCNTRAAMILSICLCRPVITGSLSGPLHRGHDEFSEAQASWTPNTDQMPTCAAGRHTEVPVSISRRLSPRVFHDSINLLLHPVGLEKSNKKSCEKHLVLKGPPLWPWCTCHKPSGTSHRSSRTSESSTTRVTRNRASFQCRARSQPLALWYLS